MSVATTSAQMRQLPLFFPDLNNRVRVHNFRIRGGGLYAAAAAAGYDPLNDQANTRQLA